MCRILKVVLVAPADRHLDLRRALSSIEYEIVGAYGLIAEIDVAADVAVVIEPTDADVAELRDRGLKVAAVGGQGDDADLTLDADDLRTFRTRVWELFRARP